MRSLAGEMSDEDMATERWENEGGHVVRLMTLQIQSVTVEAQNGSRPHYRAEEDRLTQGAPCYAQTV